MEIRLGPSGIPISCKGKSSVEGVKTVAELGLDAMEISFTHGIHMSLKTAKKIGEVARGLDVELSIHVPYFVNLASEKKKVIEDSKKRIIDSLERGNIMNATVVAVHAGYYGKDKEEAHKMIFEACKEINNKIEKNKWNVKFGIETMGKQKVWGTLDEIIKICKKLKHVIPYLDPAHIYARNGGNINYKEIFDKLKVLKLKKYHSHFSGIKYSLVGIGRGNERHHVPMREAGNDFEPFAKEILKRKIDITIISESPILEEDSLLMRKIFKKLGYDF
ncbi:MAG: TIM barrel protein [Candidatus Aenigmarchaeota archaeon]|nr:TIM barrel protein [Candidatus Aenigmarchaeota archaeon]